MRPGAWYLAALGDSDAQALYPDAPLLLPTDQRSWSWRRWSPPLLARMAYHAAALTLPVISATAADTGYDPHAFATTLARMHECIEREQATMWRSVVPARRPQLRLRARLRSNAGWHAATAVAAATRALGPFQSRDRLDPDVPRATQLALLHAADARYAIAYAQPQAGPAFERIRVLEAMIAAAQRRLAHSPRWVDSRADAETAGLRRQRLSAHIARLEHALGAAPPYELPNREAQLASLFSEVVVALRPWLLAQEQLSPPQLLVGRVKVIGEDGRSWEITYGPDGQIQALHSRKPDKRGSS